ncbi:MAG: efflux RND transporter permease subunit [Bacteroidetes bacterium]|nr:efflux RND transporter permease subunit [Bacteroidota bacterium]
MKTRRFRPTEFAIDNRLTVYFFIAILIVFGIYSYRSTPKESFPEIVFPYFSITTIYPGTSPADMENLVTRHIEKELKTVKGIKQIYSNSLQDYSMIFIEFETNVDNKTAQQDVKDAVDRSKKDLPSDLPNSPEVTRIDLSEIPVLYINLSGDIGLAQMKKYADDLKDRIEGMEEITRVDIVGALEREFQINVDLYKMQAADITFDDIDRKVAYENMTISSGQVEMAGMKRTLRILGEFKGVEDIQNILIKNGIYLKDIAEVVDGFADRTSYSRLNGQDVITLNVVKKSGKNLINAIDKIKVILEDFKTVAPSNLVITTTGDQSTTTRNNLSELFNTMIIGFMVVVLILMFFMGVDNALFVATSIPLSVLMTFIMIPLVGFTMNMVVFVAFILVLGLVVDDSIVVVENTYRHFMHTPNLPIGPAAKLATAEVAGPVFTGTITTIAPFLPLAFWPGVAGKFMLYIPITIIISLMASLVSAFFINPVFAASFMKYRDDAVQDNKKRNKEILIISAVLVLFAILFAFVKVRFMTHILLFFLIMYVMTKYIIIPMIRVFQKKIYPFLIESYKKQLSYFLTGKRPYYLISGVVVLFFFTFFLMGVFPPKVVLFPSGDPNEIYVYVKMPAGTDIAVTDSVTKIVENRVFEVIGRNNPDVESVISNVAMNAGESIFERSTQEKLGRVAISFVEYKYRAKPHTTDYLDQIREKLKDIPGAGITVGQARMGPPAGKPINIEVSGEDFDRLIPTVTRLQHYIDSLNIQGIEQMKMDLVINTPELVLNIDRAKANKLGLSTAAIGMNLRTALYGKDISKIREGEDEYDIRLRLQKPYRENLETLLNVNVAAQQGGGNGQGGNGNRGGGGPKMVPISSVVNADYASTYGGILRKDYKRVITLSSNVLTGYNANEIVAKLRKELKGFKLEEGYAIKFTGEQQQQQENAQFLSMAFLMAIFLIMIVLVAQFNSIVKPLIIMTQIIFSMIGVLLGTIIFKIDFSIMMTGMGIIAVGGIVIKNGIMLIDFTNVLISRGVERKQAIIQGGAVRITPVLLTAGAALLGLLPLAIGLNFNFMTFFTELDPEIFFGGPSATFWKPLAWTIIFGLSFATFLTLILVPCMYSVFVKVKKSGN